MYAVLRHRPLDSYAVCTSSMRPPRPLNKNFIPLRSETRFIHHHRCIAHPHVKNSSSERSAQRRESKPSVDDSFKLLRHISLRAREVGGCLGSREATVAPCGGAALTESRGTAARAPSPTALAAGRARVLGQQQVSRPQAACGRPTRYPVPGSRWRQRHT